jgi:FixJ family two-component response regulator
MRTREQQVSNPDSQFCSIAIVDDDAQVRVGLRSLLRSYGYTVDAYDSAAALLDDHGQDRHHCIITDLQMPGMSGVELLEQLRRDGCRLPVILMTAFPEANLRKRAFQSGASCFLSKPFEANELLLCLKQASGN